MKWWKSTLELVVIFPFHSSTRAGLLPSTGSGSVTMQCHEFPNRCFHSSQFFQHHQRVIRFDFNTHLNSHKIYPKNCCFWVKNFFFFWSAWETSRQPSDTRSLLGLPPLSIIKLIKQPNYQQIPDDSVNLLYGSSSTFCFYITSNIFPIFSLYFLKLISFLFFFLFFFVCICVLRK